MAQAGRRRQPPEKAITGKLLYVGIGDRTPPAVRIELTGPKGEKSTVKVASSGEFELGAQLIGKGYHLAILPDNGGEARYFTLDAFAEQLGEARILHVPPLVWQGWIWPFTCVTGQVLVCRPWFDIDPRLDFALLKSRLSTTQFVFNKVNPLPWVRCFPVCNGKVEVFVQTCCCPIIEPPIVIRKICEIIDCTKLVWPPPIGPVGPGPDPGPEFEQIVIPALRRAVASAEGPTPERVTALAKDLFALRQMSLTEQMSYIQGRPDLVYLCCACSTRKVAETPLNADGRFDACFFLGLVPFNCTRRVIYRVSQLQAGAWVVIYDGFGSGQSFGLDEDAGIYARWNAQACEGEPPPIQTGPLPFVLLEEIGSTWAFQLVRSTEQSGEITWAAPAATDGLVNPPINQPWAKTPALRFQFHPGLAALNAKYYRVRVIPLSGGGSPFTIKSNLSWYKFYDDGTGVGVESISLNNPVINGIDGLYTIPYPDLAWPWLGGQYHSYIDTTVTGRTPNGQYLFVVDIFDAAGQRLDPAGSLDPAGAGDVPNVGFQYLRMDPPPAPGATIPTHVIPHNALANLFLVDNTRCYGNIEALLENGVASADNCQFLVGTNASTLAIQYSAYQSEGFQDYHTLWVKKGLFGPTITDDSGTANVYSADSPPQTFGTLLSGDARCAFSSTLAVICKHTDGSSHIWEYDSWDTVAFSLMT